MLLFWDHEIVISQILKVPFYRNVLFKDALGVALARRMLTVKLEI